MPMQITRAKTKLTRNSSSGIFRIKCKSKPIKGTKTTENSMLKNILSSCLNENGRVRKKPGINKMNASFKAAIKSLSIFLNE